MKVASLKILTDSQIALPKRVSSPQQLKMYLGTFIYCIYVQGCVYGVMNHGAHVKVKGQLVEVSCLPKACRSQELTSYRQSWWQLPLPIVLARVVLTCAGVI